MSSSSPVIIIDSDSIIEPIICYKNEEIENIYEEDLVKEHVFTQTGVKITKARKSNSRNLVLYVEKVEDIKAIMDGQIFGNCKKFDMNTLEKRPHVIITNADKCLCTDDVFKKKLNNLGIIELVEFENKKDNNDNNVENKSPAKKAICKDVETQVKLIKLQKTQICFKTYYFEPPIGKIKYCINCKMIGYHDKCWNEPACEICGEKEQHKNCTRPPKCANCGRDHVAFSRVCPVYKEEKERKMKKSIAAINRKNGATSNGDAMFIDIDSICNVSHLSNNSKVDSAITNKILENGKTIDNLQKAVELFAEKQNSNFAQIEKIVKLFLSTKLGTTIKE
jgi:hypothetical protein